MSSSLLTCPTRSHIFLVLCIIFYIAIFTSSKPDLRYHEHCESVVPHSPPSSSPQFAIIPFPQDQDGYFLGGGDIFSHPNSSTDYYFSSNRRVIRFRTHDVYRTEADDVYKVEASLMLLTSDMNYYDDSYFTQVSEPHRSPLSFELEGFWSNSTGKICMVGSGSTHSQEGKLHNSAAVLKLDGVRSSNTLTSLLTGTLESLSSADDSGYFDSISLLLFPKMNYKYTAVPKEMESGCSSGIDVPKESSLSLPLSRPVCSVFLRWRNSFELKYGSACNSSKRCNPFGEAAEYLPQLMSLSVIQCSEDRQSLSFLLEFHNTSYVDYYSAFDPNTTVVAEGSWDPKKNEICVVGCRILDATNSLSSSRVGDCLLRMSLRFPAVWSIRNSSGIVGHIWINKPANESGYFDRIMFQSDESYMIPRLKYEYTLVDKARNICSETKPASSSKGKQYPVGNSYDMGFQMRYKNSKQRGWGYSKPIFVGDQVSPQIFHMISSSSSSPEARTHHPGLQNISYRMSLASVRFLAEGIYDEETGRLCMMACNQTLLSNDSMDCEIFINIQFPPINSNDYIKGSIVSTRQKSDPLYFNPLNFSARSDYMIRQRESIWRMDLEIVMALISNTLVCVFVGYQILYAKKHPNIVFPFISFFMLVMLTLGSLIPLVLNFEALFFPKENRSSFLIKSGGWLEVNEVIVRLITMLAFLLQFRLLQLVWSARMADKNQKASWVAEMKTFFVCLPLYIAGVLIAVSIVNWRRKKLGIREGMLSTYGNHSLWADMRSCAGLILDGFLLPQILLNVFQNSIQNALSNFFYIGTTLVRLLPHAYDLYRAYYYAEYLDFSYIYADPATDYYSAAWDVIIPLGGLLFAAIICLQQRFGGRFFLPKRFNKELEIYEKVPVANDA